jgi:hypothetical protein
VAAPAGATTITLTNPPTSLTGTPMTVTFKATAF